MDKILIRVSQNTDGDIFRLDPRVKKLISDARHYQANIVDKLFIAYDNIPHEKALYNEIYQQIVTLLTGLSIEKIQTLGTIQFIDSVDERILFEKERINA